MVQILFILFIIPYVRKELVLGTLMITIKDKQERKKQQRLIEVISRNQPI